MQLLLPSKFQTCLPLILPEAVNNCQMPKYIYIKITIQSIDVSIEMVILSKRYNNLVEYYHSSVNTFKTNLYHLIAILQCYKYNLDLSSQRSRLISLVQMIVIYIQFLNSSVAIHINRRLHDAYIEDVLYVCKVKGGCNGGRVQAERESVCYDRYVMVMLIKMQCDTHIIIYFCNLLFDLETWSVCVWWGGGS